MKNGKCLNLQVCIKRFLLLTYFLVLYDTFEAMTYTQLLTDKNGQELDVMKHGLNRDAVRAAWIGHHIGVVAVADGCGLTFWSEIAAHIAVNEFVLYCEKNIPKESPYSPTAMKDFLRLGIHHVNQAMLNWKHPKTKAKCNVLDKGGNTTLVVAVVFPYAIDDTEGSTPIQSSNQPSGNTASNPNDLSNNTNFSGGSGNRMTPPTKSSSTTSIEDSKADTNVNSKPRSPSISRAASNTDQSVSPSSTAGSINFSSSFQHHASSASSDASIKWGVVFTGMGDSDLYCFKPHTSESTPGSANVTPSSSTIVVVPSDPQHPPSPNSFNMKIQDSLNNIGNDSHGGTEGKGKESHRWKTVRTDSFSGKPPKFTPSAYHTLPTPPSHKVSKSGDTSQIATSERPGLATSDPVLAPDAERNAVSPKNTEPFNSNTSSEPSEAKNSSADSKESAEPADSPPTRRKASTENKTEDASFKPQVQSPSSSLKDSSPFASSPPDQVTQSASMPILPLEFIHSSSSNSNHLNTISTPSTPAADATPRAPCGVWLRLLTDIGKSPFIPFPGLRDKNIPPPSFTSLNLGDCIVACSDGVVSSYDGRSLWPDISAEEYDSATGIYNLCYALLQSTMDSHRQYNTDPDDVTIGALKLTSFAKKKKSDSTKVAMIDDLTPTFAPEFAHSTYKQRNYLSEYLSDYPKPKDKHS